MPVIHDILFDVGRVLVTFDPHELVAPSVSHPDEEHAVYDAMIRTPEWDRLDEGTILASDALDAWLTRNPALEAPIRDVFTHWPERMSPIPGMWALVDALRAAGHGLYVISNYCDRFWECVGMWPVLQKMHGYTVSSACQLVKPNPAIFRLTLDSFHLNASECLFIDDKPENVQAAIDVGIRGLVFTHADSLRTQLHRLGVLPS